MFNKIRFQMFLNKVRHSLRPPTVLHATIYKRGSKYVATCKETDLSVVSDTYDEAVKELKSRVKDFISKTKPGMRYRFSY